MSIDDVLRRKVGEAEDAAAIDSHELRSTVTLWEALRPSSLPVRAWMSERVSGLLLSLTEMV